MLPQPLGIAGVAIRRLNTSHKVSPWSQLADKGLVHTLAKIRGVVTGVSNSHSDTDITAESRVPAVCRPDDEVVALDQLVVERAWREYQPAAAVDVEEVAAVVNIR